MRLDRSLQRGRYLTEVHLSGVRLSHTTRLVRRLCRRLEKLQTTRDVGAGI